MRLHGNHPFAVSFRVNLLLHSVLIYFGSFSREYEAEFLSKFKQLAEFMDVSLSGFTLQRRCTVIESLYKAGPASLGNTHTGRKRVQTGLSRCQGVNRAP